MHLEVACGCSTALGNCNTAGYTGHASACTLVGYWPLDGNGNDAGPQGNSLSANFAQANHLNNIQYNAGFRGLGNHMPQSPLHLSFQGCF